MACTAKCTAHPPDANYFTDYKEIIIDHTKVSGTEDLLNFPVLISSFDVDLHNKVQVDGDDIAFSNGVSWLDHEIELFNQTYNSTHAQLVAWVRIPRLSTSTNTGIRMYYGNSTMGAQENPTGVWDSNYEFVLHMNQDPTSFLPRRCFTGMESCSILPEACRLYLISMIRWWIQVSRLSPSNHPSILLCPSGKFCLGLQPAWEDCLCLAWQYGLSGGI